MSKRRKKRIKSKVKRFKTWQHQAVNTGPSPFYRRELYHTPGDDLKAMLRTTTDYRKANPIWVLRPGFDPGVRLPVGGYVKPKKEVLRRQVHHMVMEDSTRVHIRLVCRGTIYLFEKIEKVTEHRYKSFAYTSIRSAKIAWNNGAIKWRCLDDS